MCFKLWCPGLSRAQALSDRGICTYSVPILATSEQKSTVSASHSSRNISAFPKGNFWYPEPDTSSLLVAHRPWAGSHRFWRALLGKASFHGQTPAPLSSVSQEYLFSWAQMGRRVHTWLIPWGAQASSHHSLPLQPWLWHRGQCCQQFQPSGWNQKDQLPTRPHLPKTTECLAMLRAFIQATVPAQEQKRATPPQEFPQNSAGSSQAPC